MNVTEYHAKAARAMPEKMLQQHIMDWCNVHDWLAYHTFDSRKSKEGFPDVVAVKGYRLVIAELKREGEKPTFKQQRWLNRLGNIAALARQVEVYVWRPSDWLSGEIQKVLT